MLFDLFGASFSSCDVTLPRPVGSPDGPMPGHLSPRDQLEHAKFESMSNGKIAHQSQGSLEMTRQPEFSDKFANGMREVPCHSSHCFSCIGTYRSGRAFVPEECDETIYNPCNYRSYGRMDLKMHLNRIPTLTSNILNF